VSNRWGKIIYPDSHKLFVGNLLTECKDVLVNIFSPYGEVRVLSAAQEPILYTTFEFTTTTPALWLAGAFFEAKENIFVFKAHQEPILRSRVTMPAL
jgi:hypothetical protein